MSQSSIYLAVKQLFQEFSVGSSSSGGGGGGSPSNGMTLSLGGTFDLSIEPLVTTAGHKAVTIKSVGGVANISVANPSNSQGWSQCWSLAPGESISIPTATPLQVTGSQAVIYFYLD